MPLRLGFDLDGVFADMEAELSSIAQELFALPAGSSRQSAGGSRQTADGSPQSQSRVGSQSPRAGRQSVVDSQAAAGGQMADDGQAPDAGQRPVEEDPIPELRITARQQRRLWDHVESIENFWETLAEIEPGSVARLAALAAERRWEIIFLTRRPGSAGATSQVQSQRWLEAKGFPLPSVFVVQGSRGRIASALSLDIVIDDTPENCLDVMVDSRARAILVWRDGTQAPPPATKRMGIGVVKSVGECLDILAQVDGPAQGRVGVLDRVKRLLGLGEAAQT